MAASFRVSTDHAALSRKLQQSVRRFPRAAAAGINRAAQGALTFSVREIQRDIAASSQKTIRRNMSLERATQEKTEARIIARSTKTDRIPLYEMRPRPRSVTRRRPPGGVRYGRDNKLIAGSFIARMPGGHIGVLKRRFEVSQSAGAAHAGFTARLPIDELKGPSVALVFSRKTITDKVLAYLRDKVPQEIQRAFRFVTG